jgi:Polyketide cyclase / dehydrase and lipid transport
VPTATRGEARIVIAASPEQVYDVVSDVTSIGERSPECHRCEWLDGASVATVGARFKGYNRLGLLRWSTTSVVTVAEPGREFAFMVLAGERDSTRWRYFIDRDDSATTLTESYEFLWCPALSRIAEAPIPRDKQLRRGITQTLERVKAAAEARAGADR